MGTVLAVVLCVGAVLFALTFLLTAPASSPQPSLTTAGGDAPPADGAPPSSSAMPGNAVGGVVADSTRPLAVRIPAIDVDSPLVPLGLDPHGALEVPRDYDTAGWYRYGPRPGDLGPSLIAAHADSTSGPAAFFRLADISPGDDVLVDYDDGTTVVFRVARVEQHPKDAFPTQRVYGRVAGRQLRLVTCGGVFDSRTGHYRDNIIVYAYVRSERRTGASL